MPSQPSAHHAHCRSPLLPAGASMVYSEELVDRSVINCVRSENAALGTIDFRHPDGKLIFSTVPEERVAFQSLPRLTEGRPPASALPARAHLA